MNQNERHERVTRITSAWLDGRATDAEIRELNELLRGEPDACELYLGLVETHATLVHDHAGDEVAERMAEIVNLPAPRPMPVRSTSYLPPWWAAIAAVVVALLAVVANRSHRDAALFPEPEPVAEAGVAVLSRLVNAEWMDAAAAPAEGAVLAPGAFRLRSGLAQVEFFNGASVIVEGPAELDLVSAVLARCRSGRLRVSVPEPAQGFTIETADFRAVDLGTEFALVVAPDGRSEVHVVEGEVRLDDRTGAELRRLTTGHGVRAGAGAAFEPMPVAGTDFVGRQRFFALANDDWRTRHAAWTRSRLRLRERDDVLLLFDFEDQQPWDRQLLNRRRDGPGGAIVGAQWTQGRWPGKGALEFKRVTDRVRLRVPGEFDALTLAAWVRLEGFDRWLSSLLLTDDWDEGEVHWQITDKGELICGVAKSGMNVFSPPVIHPVDLGRWLHVAVTVDRVAGRIVHYLDGRPVSEHAADRAMPPLRIGDAEIGNWRSDARPHPIRSLNGRVDELVVFKRALTADEVAALGTVTISPAPVVATR